MHRYQKQEVEEFLLLLEGWLRDAMMLQEGSSPPGAADEGDALRRFVERYPGMNIAAALGAVDRAISLVHKNVYIPLTLLNLAFALRECINPADDREPGTAPRSSTGPVWKGFHE
jgi:hypothetical protein